MFEQLIEEVDKIIEMVKIEAIGVSRGEMILRAIRLKLDIHKAELEANEYKEIRMKLDELKARGMI